MGCIGKVDDQTENVKEINEERCTFGLALLAIT